MSRRIYKREAEAPLERLFRALADRTRLRLLNLMRDQEICVCYFVEVLRSSQPKISRHLAYLRKAGAVAARRQGTWMHYRIVNPSDPRAARILKEVLASLADDREMQRDLQRLHAACCTPQKFVTLQGAPAPVRLSEQLQEGVRSGE
jgi:ArsR family transcriptional regulator